MQIAGIKLKTPFVSAPMAGVSSPAFRLMARSGGASLVYTEMVAALGLSMVKKRVFKAAVVLAEERPVAMQLFGSDPESMRIAAEKASRMGIDLIDINMGCPAKKVRRQGAGSALLEDAGLAREVAAAAVEGSSLPVTVKVRLGYSSDQLESFLPGILDTGIAAVTLHARTTMQGFSGQADWSRIKALKSWCPVPVIGNGDVRSGTDAVRMMEETGCDAVMIGRATMGDPWIFARAKARLEGREPEPISIAQRKAALEEHVALARRVGGEGHALHFLRKFMMWYTRGLPGAVAFRRSAGPLGDVDLLWQASRDYFDGLLAAERAA